MSLQSRLLVGLLMPVVAVSIGACGQPTEPTKLEVGKLADEQLSWELLTSRAQEALDKKDAATAETYFKQAIDVARQVGQEGPEVASATSNLANFYYVQGDGEKADELYQESVSMRQKSVGVEHVDIARDLIGLAKVYVLKKDYAKAAPTYKRAIDMLKKLGEPLPEGIEKEYEDARKAA